MLKSKPFLLSCFALSINTRHFDDDIVKLDLSIPKYDSKRKRQQLSKKQRKERAKEHRAKQARKINYKNQKLGIINPTKQTSSMILAFNPIFKQPILAATKIHTFREDKHNRWKPGMRIHMATGVRTKNFNCFNDIDNCVSTQIVIITYQNAKRKKDEKYWPFKGLYYKISVDGKFLNNQQIIDIAYNDGFKSVDDFFTWFKDGFNGKIIHWTNFKY